MPSRTWSCGSPGEERRGTEPQPWWPLLSGTTSSPMASPWLCPHCSDAPLFWLLWGGGRGAAAAEQASWSPGLPRDGCPPFLPAQDSSPGAELMDGAQNCSCLTSPWPVTLGGMPRSAWHGQLGCRLPRPSSAQMWAPVLKPRAPLPTSKGENRGQGMVGDSKVVSALSAALKIRLSLELCVPVTKKASRCTRHLPGTHSPYPSS